LAIESEADRRMMTPKVTPTLLVLFAIVHLSVCSDKLFFNDETRRRGTQLHSTVGENVVLECEAGGSPSPTIHWLHHGKRIQQVCQKRMTVSVFALRCCGVGSLSMIYRDIYLDTKSRQISKRIRQIIVAYQHQ